MLLTELPNTNAKAKTIELNMTHVFCRSTCNMVMPLNNCSVAQRIIQLVDWRKVCCSSNAQAGFTRSTYATLFCCKMLSFTCSTKAFWCSCTHHVAECKHDCLLDGKHTFQDRAKRGTKTSWKQSLHSSRTVSMSRMREASSLR